jgi:membrane-associated protein
MKTIPYNVIKRIATLTLICGVVIFLLTRHVDIGLLLETGGIIAIAATIFAETGLLIGFFLPGDTLLFAAGFFAAQGKISLIGSIIAVVLGAIIGNMAGYEIGRRTGPKLFTKEDALLLTPETINKAQTFYKNHGGKTILLARFVPVVRTLAPLIAGMGKMDYRKFMFYNVLGALIWGIGITLVGFWAGKVVGKFFSIDKYLLPIILLATFLTFGVSFWHIIKNPTQRQLLKKKFKNYIKNFFKN